MRRSEAGPDVGLLGAPSFKGRGPPVLLQGVTANGGLDIALDEEEREALLLSAYRNGIFRSPPPVRVVRGEILEAFPVLSNLMEALG